MYKETKEDIKEIAKDLKATGKWLVKTSDKLRKFNERDIFEEHDTTVKQLKELDGKVTAIITILSDTMKRTGDSIEAINVLYKAVRMLLKRIKDLEDNKADKISNLSRALALGGFGISSRSISSAARKLLASEKK